MGAARGRPSSRLVGRGTEQALLADALTGTASGHPCAVVVHGEAGAGKTRLVREVCDAPDGDVQVLWGSCVHFGGASVPFVPVTGALQSWLTQADSQRRTEVLAGAGELSAVLPALGGVGSGEPGRLLPLIDLVFDRIAAQRPTVVVIDDLQWADRTSLDVLAYLITGFREQRLALLATCRDEQRGEGHPLHGWLADMRRMPSFTELHLDRLDLAATESQVESLLGHAVDIELTAQIHERSAGNPYLTELLVRGLSGDKLPPAAPAVLRDALLATWHSLSAPARQATRVLAVAGRPTDLDVTTSVAAEHGVESAELPACLAEAEDQGVVRPERDGRPWFRHPLLAEVLYDGMPLGECARVHSTYVRVLESMPADVPGRAADLAVHNQRAGNAAESYRWSIAAAEQAASLRAAGERAVHLERACSLWEAVPPEVRGPEHLDLLRQTSQACGLVGQLATAVSLAEQALRLVDPVRDPLLTSTLLLARRKLSLPRPEMAQAVDPELLEAVRLTEPYPDSPERAQALAALAVAEHWDALDKQAWADAEDAVAVARRSGSALALAAALSARSVAHLYTVGNSLEDAEEAVRLARSCDSVEWLEDAATWRVHSLYNLGRIADATASALEVCDAVVERSSDHLLTSLAAGGLLDLGQWDDCRRLLRTALAARSAGRGGASIRLTAAQLAVRQGRLAEARLHVERAAEVIAADFTGLRGLLTTARTEVLVASGEPQRALEILVEEIFMPHGLYNSVQDECLPLFAGTAADVAQAARDAGDDEEVARAIAVLDEGLGRWPVPPFTVEREDVLDEAACKALFEAEVARCKGLPGQAELWQRAVDACHLGTDPWQETVSRVRCARAELSEGAPASAVSQLLRDAHHRTLELGAEPLRREVETLARLARVDLREPVAMPAESPAPLAALTARERQILTYLMAGRSNGDIGRELVITEKTVSVHVSNILRKTGTTNRLEAAALAERLGAAQTPPKPTA
ncbi:LuxR family transcriptional regulator [Kribbella capetownensis]|uniref:LuxR family transcriptional regulator n=1 Tax=Kribbella capetownensis TaxID=1572659 RepID=A0A4R0JJU0_9ACTN|nr:LuxR family transcriptional regulator [Kribbella capetownensis]TCC46869.1 LuxR family transcriptional regulator [Kribbella capetownensis]